MADDRINTKSVNPTYSDEDDDMPLVFRRPSAKKSVPSSQASRSMQNPKPTPDPNSSLKLKSTVSNSSLDQFPSNAEKPTGKILNLEPAHSCKPVTNPPQKQWENLAHPAASSNTRVKPVGPVSTTQNADLGSKSFHTNGDGTTKYVNMVPFGGSASMMKLEGTGENALLSERLNALGSKMNAESDLKQASASLLAPPTSNPRHDSLPNNGENSRDNIVTSISRNTNKPIPQAPLSTDPKAPLNETENGDSSEDDSQDNVPLSQLFNLSNSLGSNKSEIMKHLFAKSDTSNSLDSKRTRIIPLKREREVTSEEYGTPLIKREKGDAGTMLSERHRETKSVEEHEEEDSDDMVPLVERVKGAPGYVLSEEKSTSTTSDSKEGTKKPVQIVKKPLKDLKSSKGFSTAPSPSDGGKKWDTLVHNGVIFPPPYKPHGVKMLYDGQLVDLTPDQEEVATMFAVMKDTDYASKLKFIQNFMEDWGKILGKDHIVKKFELCDFTPIYEWHQREKEKKQQMSSDEKKALKEEKLKQEEKYMYAFVDGVQEKVGNFRVEPPGLFRGRGEHPKMGKLKKRIRPSDITINIGKGAPIPECPIPGERWKEVRHDNRVTWLAFWNDPVNPKDIKYVFLAPNSTLKGENNKKKYEKARLLKEYINKIREDYTRDFTSKSLTRRQIAVATYLIDKLALRAGNERDDDKADTVGCCTLKIENVACVPPNKLQFDFLGKDSIRYLNTVEVELLVYKAIEDFRAGNDGNGKKEGDDLFDMLDTSKLNAHLKELMPNLTAKVFHTYNASITLDKILNKEKNEGTVAEKIAVYQKANKEVAIICNHQHSISKSHESQMKKLNEKISELKALKEELEENLMRVWKGKSLLSSRKLSAESTQKKLSQIEARIEKLEFDKNMKEDLKTVALGTSKINYLDPRISVAWCKRNEVPIEKIFNKSLLAKFAWAMDVEPDYRF